MRILLVEDNADHRELMRLALTGHNLTWQIEGVVSGEEVLRCLAEGEGYDVVFLDYSLPGRDGLEVLEEIRRGEVPPPVVMVTGRGDEQVAVGAMKGGAYDYVVKVEGYLQRLPVLAQRAMEAYQFALKRKQAEQALSESEQRYRNLVEYAPDVIYTLAPDGTITSLNPAFERITGWSRSEWLNKQFAPILHPDDLSRGLEFFQRIMKGEKITPFELRALRKSGDYLVAEFVVTPQTQNGSVIGILGIARDITERKQAEEALRESEERYHSFFDNSIDAVMLTAPNGTILAANSEACHMFGYTEEELRRVGRNGIVDTSDPRLLIALEERTRTGKFKGELIQIRKDGTKFPTEISTAIFKDKDGHFKTSMIIRDITEHKQAEEALKESESRFRSIIESSKDGIIFFDGKTRKILFGNGTMAELLGYSKEGLVGRSIPSLHPPEDWESIEQEFQKHVRGEISISTGIPVLRSDGSVFYADISSSLIPLDGIFYFSAFFRDITERKRAEEALCESEERLRAMFEHMSSGVAVYKAHEEGQDFVFKDFNPAAERITRITREQAVGHRLLGLFPYMDRSGLLDALRRVWRTGQSEHLSPFYYKDTIREGWRENRIYKLPSGEVVAIFDDITERKQMEEVLRRSEEEAKRLAQESAIMADIGRIISSSLNIEEVYEYFAEEVQKLIPFDSIAINMINHKEGTVTVPYVSKITVPRCQPGDVLPLLGSVTGELMRTRSGLIIQTENRNELQTRFPTLLTAFDVGLRTVIAVPLISKDRVIGAIHFRSAKSNAYSEHDLKLAESISSQIAGAIANAQLFIEHYNGPQNLDSVISYTWEIKGGGPSGTNAKEVSAFI